MKTRAILPVCILAVLFAFCSRDREITQPQPPAIDWSGTLDEAKIEAQKTGRSILVSFEAYWCPWSRLLRESLYVAPAVIESLRSYKCVAIDADRDSSLCGEYDVNLYPTIIVMDPYGGELQRIVGYYPPQEFLRQLSYVRQGDQVLREMFRKEEQSRDDPRFLMDFGNLLRNMGTYDAALLRYERAGQMDRGNKLGIAEEAAFAMAECNMLAGQFGEAGNRFKVFAEAGPGNEQCEEAAILAALCYQEAKDRKSAIAALEEYLRGNRDGVFSEFARARIAALKGAKTRGR